MAAAAPPRRRSSCVRCRPLPFNCYLAALFLLIFSCPFAAFQAQHSYDERQVETVVSEAWFGSPASRKKLLDGIGAVETASPQAGGQIECQVCFGEVPPHEASAAACGHFFCKNKRKFSYATYNFDVGSFPANGGSAGLFRQRVLVSQLCFSTFRCIKTSAILKRPLALQGLSHQSASLGAPAQDHLPGIRLRPTARRRHACRVDSTRHCRPVPSVRTAGLCDFLR